AIGSAAVQIMKHLGVEVVAVCSTPHLALVKSLGADTVIDYLQEDFTKISKKFDFVFDAVGKTSFGACKPLLKEKGIYVSTELGKYGQNIWYALITPVFRGKKVIFPMPLMNQEQIEYLQNLV